MEAERWIGEHVEIVAPLGQPRVRPWSTVVRVPTAAGPVWFKACAPVQAFEPRLSAQLAERWPDRVGRVLAHDVERRWLLLADAGEQLAAAGNPPEAWLQLLPRYAELQRGEAAHADDHLEHDVPDLRLERLPAVLEELPTDELPLTAAEEAHLRALAPRFGELCDELAQAGVPPTVQHDDLHLTNVFTQGDRLRVLDWGDASVGHPFFSLVVAFRFLEEVNGLEVDDAWFARLRDAYLEPWGSGLVDVLELALRVGSLAHPLARVRQRRLLGDERPPAFDEELAHLLRRALDRVEPSPRA